MEDAQSFFDKDTPHGLVKRIMYKKYLQAFVPITQQAKFRNGEQAYKTLIIDGFAGAGRYGETWPKEIEKYGSPLIALMVALNFFYKKEHKRDKRWGNPSEVEDIDQITDLVDTMSFDDTERATCRVFLIFIEKDRDNFEKLKDNIAKVLDDFFLNPDVSYKEDGDRNGSYCFQIVHPKYPIECQIYKGEFIECHKADKLLEDPTVKCLTFLDPFGYSQIPFEAVKRYLGKNKSVIINFMSSYVNRFAGKDISNVSKVYGIDTVRAQRTTENHEEDRSLIDFEKYVLRNFRVAGGEKPTNNIENCTAVYEKALKAVLSVDYTLSFEMRGKKNNIIYHLIFATGHLKDVEIMKESMNRCSQSEIKLGMSDYTFVRNGSQLNLNNTQNSESVADAVFQKFNGKRSVSINDIKNFVLLETPFVFRKGVLSLMLNETDPRIENVCDVRGDHPERKGSFPDRTDWYLTFKYVQEEETDEVDENLMVADIIFEKFKGQTVPLSEIKTYVSLHSGYRFTKRPLIIMEKESNPRIVNVVGPPGIKKRKKRTFPDRANWEITFRSA